MPALNVLDAARLHSEGRAHGGARRPLARARAGLGAGNRWPGPPVRALAQPRRGDWPPRRRHRLARPTKLRRPPSFLRCQSHFTHAQSGFTGSPFQPPHSASRLTWSQCRLPRSQFDSSRPESRRTPARLRPTRSAPHPTAGPSNCTPARVTPTSGRCGRTTRQPPRPCLATGPTRATRQRTSRAPHPTSPDSHRTPLSPNFTPEPSSPRRATLGPPPSGLAVRPPHPRRRGIMTEARRARSHARATHVPHPRTVCTRSVLMNNRQLRVLDSYALLKSAKTDPERIDRLKRDARLLKKQFRDAYAGIADRAVPTRRLADLMRIGCGSASGVRASERRPRWANDCQLYWQPSRPDVAAWQDWRSIESMLVQQQIRPRCQSGTQPRWRRRRTPRGPILRH